MVQRKSAPDSTRHFMNHGVGEIYGIPSTPARFAVPGLEPVSLQPSCPRENNRDAALRAPLRHMAGYTELLQRKASSVVEEKSNHYMAMMLESAKRMGNLIDDLLAFSRIGRAETDRK